MKKLLFVLAAAVVAGGASAQQANKGVPFEGHTMSKHAEPAVYENVNVPYNYQEVNARSASKNTGPGGSRWYDHFFLVDQLNGGALGNNDFVFPMWHDSTVTQYFGGTSPGYRRVNWSSICQNMDPLRSRIFNDPGFSGQQVIQVKEQNSYVIDSIGIRGAYVRMPSRPANIVDTLIFSVIPQDTRTFFLLKSNATYGSEIPLYTTRDTLWANAPVNVDSINRAALPPDGMTARAFWKVPLTAADGDTPLSNGSYTTRSFRYAVPGGGLTIPAGNMFAFTVTFKSGDVWQRNVDSVNMFHRFMPVSASVSPNSAMPFYRELQVGGQALNDRSMSGLMFSWDSSSYDPSVFIEIFNEVSYNYEFHDFAAHVTCADCDYVSVDDIATEVFSKNAYPNPASTVVNIPFVLNRVNDATVSLTNSVGQVVRSQSFSQVQRGEAQFNTANLSDGLYFYTIEVNGQRETGRVAIVH